MGHRPRWGWVWGVTIPMGTKMDFSEYSVVVSPPLCFIQTPEIGGEDWGGCRMRAEGPQMEAEGRERGWGSCLLERGSKLLPQARRGANRCPRPRAEMSFLGEGSKRPPHQLGGLGERCELPSGVQGGAPTAQRFFHYYQHLGWPFLTL